jgi:hypothetical protein
MTSSSDQSLENKYRFWQNFRSVVKQHTQHDADDLPGARVADTVSVLTHEICQQWLTVVESRPLARARKSGEGSETARANQAAVKCAVVAEIQAVFEEFRKKHPKWEERALKAGGLAECQLRGIERSERQIRRYIKKGEVKIS